MWTDANIGEGLRMDKTLLLFFKNQDTVVFRIICKINAAVSGNGMPLIDFICQNQPFIKRLFQRIGVNNLVMVAVYDKIGI